MVQFILNEQEIKTNVSPGLTMLDFIRYNRHLTGTKIGCREGDCGACTILVGELKNGRLSYSSATSCLMPIANAHGKHIVTIEGINLDTLNAVQQAFAEEGATQCGFCTPGFIVSLTGFCINEATPSYDKAIDAMNGNICRCTGYKSIERAAATVSNTMQRRNGTSALQFAVDNRMIPSYFLDIESRLAALLNNTVKQEAAGEKYVGGGTDLYVQQHDTIVDEPLNFLYDKSELKGISRHGNTCVMGSATTVTDIAESKIFKDHFKELPAYIKLVSSTQIRNMATIAGNFTNASPIGDFTIFFLALDARISLANEETKREIFLKDFYKGYKSLDKQPGEIIEKIMFELPSATDLFNFEKVCKRTNLDIASVNSAICLRMQDEQTIAAASLSAGGVGPVPMYLAKSSAFLLGKRVTASLIHELTDIVQSEISPISDARGTEAYKRLLLSQLIKAHFIKLFPALPLEHVMYL